MFSVNNHADQHSNLHEQQQESIENVRYDYATAAIGEDFFREYQQDEPMESSVTTKNNNIGAVITKTKSKLPRVCPYCNKTFKNSTNVAKHIRTHTGERPYQCDYCQKCFGDRSHYNKHVRIHKGIKPFKCAHCERSFNTSHNLKAHIRLHTGERPYECKECGQTFYKSNHLTLHLKVHTGQTPFLCHYCGGRFNNKSRLSFHVNRVHSIEAEKTKTGNPKKCGMNHESVDPKQIIRTCLLDIEKHVEKFGQELITNSQMKQYVQRSIKSAMKALDTLHQQQQKEQYEQDLFNINTGDQKTSPKRSTFWVLCNYNNSQQVSHDEANQVEIN